jgi:hypothetical protein
MKKILFCWYVFWLCAIPACHKPPIVQPMPPTPSQPRNTHTITWKFFSHAIKPVQRSYTYWLNSNFLNKRDTVYVKQSSVTFQAQQGKPSPYMYYASLITNDQNDSTRLEIWVDGTMKANTDSSSYNLTFYY